MAAAGTTDGTPLGAEELDEAAERILGALGADIAEHTEHLDALREQDRQDQRVMHALGEGGLLPERPEVSAALDVLLRAGVSAHPGWKYLHDAAPGHQRAALISAHPELADGIVVIDPTQLDTAHTALERAQLLPSAAVAVGSGVHLLSLEAAPDAGTFVVEPTPALYDEDAASLRRDEISARMSGRAESMTAGEEQLTTARDASSDLAAYRRLNPRGHLTALQAQHERLRAQDEQALTQWQDAQSSCATAAVASASATTALTAAGSHERVVADRLTALGNLAAVIAGARSAQDSLAELEEESLKWRQGMQLALTRRADEQERARGHERAAVQERGDAARLSAMADEVVSTAGALAAAVPAASIPELRAVAAAAQRTYELMAVNPDLRARCDQAADKRRQVEAALSQRDPLHVREAERLRQTPQGADRAGWTVALGNARRRRDLVTAQAVTASQNVGRLEQAVAAAKPTEPGRSRWASVDEQWRPTSREHGQELHRAARRALREAQQRLEDAGAALATVSGRREHAPAGRDSLRARHRRAARAAARAARTGTGHGRVHRHRARRAAAAPRRPTSSCEPPPRSNAAPPTHSPTQSAS